jgi:hypothetical protein
MEGACEATPMKKTQERTMSFPETLIWLLTDLQYARASFAISCDLPRAHPAAVASAPFFFQLTTNRHADAVNLHVTKLYDHSRTLSIPGLLTLASKHAGTFNHASAPKVREEVAIVRKSILRFAPLLKALNLRRNQSIAHMDPTTVVNPGRYVARGFVRTGDLAELLELTGLILNRLSMLYRGVSLPLDNANAGDYRNALDLIARSRVL